MRGDVDDAHELARRRQPFERFAADAGGVEQDDFVAQGFQAFGHALDAGGGAAERRNRDQRRFFVLVFSLAPPSS